MVDDQDVVIDLVGNVADDTGTRSLDVLRAHGLVVNVPTGSWPTMAEEAEARGIRATGYSVSPDARTLSVITRLIDDGSVRVHVERELAARRRRGGAPPDRGRARARQGRAAGGGGSGVGVARSRVLRSPTSLTPTHRRALPRMSRAFSTGILA